jgi:hypothetical protein
MVIFYQPRKGVVVRHLSCLNTAELQDAHQIAFAIGDDIATGFTALVVVLWSTNVALADNPSITASATAQVPMGGNMPAITVTGTFANIALGDVNSVRVTLQEVNDKNENVGQPIFGGRVNAPFQAAQYQIIKQNMPFGKKYKVTVNLYSGNPEIIVATATTEVTTPAS